jgi:CDP-diacylglycerol--glycerol-3-phosphate 3-phosphatidyltransferase
MMLDAAFSWLSAALWTAIFCAYRIRVARYGRFRAERVRELGGTALLGENIMRATYWAIDPVIHALVRAGVTANAVTWSAFVLGIAAAIAIATGWFGIACLLATLSTVCDILDGQVARVAGTGSVRGGLLDSVIDRYTEFAFVAGFLIHAHARQLDTALAALALLACFMSSYATAKSEILGVVTSRGLMRRHERAAFLILGAGLTPLLGPAMQAPWPALGPSGPFLAALGIVGAIGNAAVAARLVAISRALPAPPENNIAAKPAGDATTLPVASSNLAGIREHADGAR